MRVGRFHKLQAFYYLKTNFIKSFKFKNYAPHFLRFAISRWLTDFVKNLMIKPNYRVFIYLILPLTFLVSIPFHAHVHKHADLISNSTILLFTNNLMVYQGYIIFAVLYACFSYCNKSQYKLYLAKFISLSILSTFLHIWWFGTSIFERINISTGGHCDNILLSMTQCAKENLLWTNGFDASGHFFVLSIYIIVTLQEIYKLNDTSKNLLIASTVCVALWYFEFTITALFFHTTLEKIVGLSLGYLVPLLFLAYDKYVE